MSKGCKTAGRHKRNAQNAAYQMEDRRTKNKIRKMKRIVKKFPNDLAAKAALARLLSTGQNVVKKNSIKRLNTESRELTKDAEKRRNILTNNTTIMVDGKIHMVYRTAA